MHGEGDARRCGLPPDAQLVLAGQQAVLEGFTPDGKRAEGQFDAAEAWADTQKRRDIYQALLDCLKK